MTIAELARYINSQKRVMIREAKEKAASDYILAELIGRSVSRIYSSSAKYPSISEAYPSLFDSEEIAEKRQEKKDEMSVIRFKQFAKSFNEKFKEAKREE